MQQNVQQSFHILIAAAGSGTRLGGDIPKQYIKIAGKTVLRHTLDNILSWPGLASVHVIIDPKHADLYHDTVTGLDLPEPIHGGKERSNSINNALNKIPHVKNEDIILVHDAARPFVRWDDVSALLNSLAANQAATLAFPVSDTLRNDQGTTIDRNGLWAVQTPQGFRFEDLKKAHEQSDNKGATDDTALVSALGIDVALIESARSNIKITTQDDLTMAQALLAQSIETRTGMGFDVHAFDTENSNKPLILGGIEIPHDRPLKGHSDADVALHALTDAILGAIGQGDIGQHFPPSDDTYKDMDSTIFLEKAVQMIKGELQNLDLTIICEAPKIGAHSEKMKARIAEITSLAPERINIKATTTEGLGFTGRGEGIAAQAVATVKLQV